jgi:hypothetical protein
MTPTKAAEREGWLTRSDICKIMGWAESSSLDGAAYRTRMGTARVAFPIPDSYDRGGHPSWRQDTIDDYRRACRSAGILRPKPADVEAMFELRADGLSVEQVAVASGWSKSTVARHLKKPRPSTTRKWTNAQS